MQNADHTPAKVLVNDSSSYSRQVSSAYTGGIYNSSNTNSKDGDDVALSTIPNLHLSTPAESVHADSMLPLHVESSIHDYDRRVRHRASDTRRYQVLTSLI